MKTQQKARSLPPAKSRQVKEHANRDWIIRRARQRIASGFYERDECLDVVVERMLAPKPRSTKAGRDAGGLNARRKPPSNRAA